MYAMLKRILRRPLRPWLLKRRMRRYRSGLGAGDKFKVLFGGHWASLPDWLVLSEGEQDITKPLELETSSVDVIFTEHVIEHVGFMDGVAFMREALRILKPGGTFHVVCPVTEKLLSFSPSGERDREYLRCLERFYQEERSLFAELKFDGLSEFNRVFLLNSVFTGHGHKFIWSAALISRVLSSLGYSAVGTFEIGRGGNEEYCVERRRRGIYLGNNAEEDRAANYVYDAESLAVEARK